MEQSKQPKVVAIVPNVFQKLVGIMSELDYVAKGDKTVNGQYRFVSHDQVTAKVHPLLVKYGVAIIPSIDEVKQEGNRTTVKLLCVFLNSDNPSDQFTICSYGQGVDGGDKGIGKAYSYAYKYALLKTFCLETGDDPDNDAKSTYEPVKCVEFDLKVAGDIDEECKEKLSAFLTYTAEQMNKHPEEVKAHALLNYEGFLKALRKFKPTDSPKKKKAA